MSKTQTIQRAMMQALKDKDMQRKDSLSMLLSALKAKAKDKQADLTPEEEDTIILKEIKQTQETLDSAPSDREDIASECRARLAVLREFAPVQMSEEEIRAAIKKVLGELSIDSPTVKEKGRIMKSLMPLVKGKADGGLVNRLVGEILQ